MDALYTKTKSKMEKCLDSLDRDYSAVRAGRANPNVLNNIMVEYYGTPTPLHLMPLRLFLMRLPYPINSI